MVVAAPTPSRTVERLELRGRLDESLAKRLTVVVAPAGSGKSVLLEQWTSASPERTTVRVDIGVLDDDPIHFVRRLLKDIPFSDSDRAALAALIALGSGGLGDSFISELTLELATMGELVLILDDFHRFGNAVLVADLEALIARFPANVHTIISTRAELPGGISRYRLSGDLLELRQADLAMSYADSAELLARSSGRALSIENVGALVDKTEGWVAGLQLAGFTIRMREDPDAFVAEFSGSDRLVGDYLSQQVLDALPPEQRRTLLRLSALDTMSSELVSAATREPAAQQVFEQLERESLFLIALDDHRQWFRFHHLFLDLLRYQLRAELPHDEAVIAARAADWHLARGDAQSAVEILIRVREWDRVLDIVLRRSPELFEQGQIATVIRWLEAVPEARRAENVDAALCMGVLIGLLGQGARAEDLLSRVANRDDATAGQVACAEAFLAALVQTRPQVGRSLASATRALDLLARDTDGPVPDILHLTSRRSLETIALASGGRAHFLAGDLDLARAWFERGLASDGAEYSLWRINLLGSLALVDMWAGHLVSGEALARDALVTAREVGLTSHWATADAYIALALGAIETGHPQQAAISLHEAVVRAESSGRTQQLWVCHLARCLLAEATGEQPPATTPSGSPPPVADDVLRALRLRIRRANGMWDVPAVPVPSGPDAHQQVFEIAHNAVFQNRRDLVQDCLRTLSSEQGESPRRSVKREIVLALGAKAQGNGNRSAQHMGRALATAEPEGLVETFVRAGPDVLALVAASTDAGGSFRDVVLARAHAASVLLPGAELQTPLTKREIEVLSYLPGYYTNHELAEMCFVSVNTMKTHMVHIYQKLNVVNRSAAVTRARELGLL